MPEISTTPKTREPASSGSPSQTCSLSFLLCDGCGELHQETDDFIICECGRIAVRMEWATKEETAIHLLKRLHSSIGNRMMADDPTDEERIENLAAWNLAGKFLSENATAQKPPDSGKQNL